MNSYKCKKKYISSGFEFSCISDKQIDIEDYILIIFDIFNKFDIYIMKEIKEGIIVMWEV